MELKGLNNAWLDPYGKWVVDHPNFDDFGAWHNGLANCIVSDETGIPDFHERNMFLRKHKCSYAYEYLEKKRWIRLHGFGGLTPRFVNVSKLTKAQELAIMDWCAANERKYEDCFTR